MKSAYSIWNKMESKGVSDDALCYEVRDMQDYVQNGTGGNNLTIIRDVMAALTSVRNQWGMKYPFE